jgi:NAD(P)-dependent dehydrogenase (short-subunit alcohol dehydrogenase family)
VDRASTRRTGVAAQRASLRSPLPWRRYAIVVNASSNPDRRVVLITGGSTGIGRVTAADLAARGDTVVIVSRPTGGGREAAERIRSATSGDVHHLAADLSLMADVRTVAHHVRARWPRLDALLLNAGAYVGRRRETREGIEATWALNHLGGMLMAVLLADRLRAAAPARVVITSSNAAMGGRIHWQDPELRSGYAGFRAYAQSKLANQLLAVELGRRLAGSGVHVHAMHPGFVATEFGGDAGRLTPLVRLAQRIFGRSPERGADTLTFLASDPEGAAASGRYWVDRRQVEMAPGARDPGAAARLWELSAARAGITAAELARLEPTVPVGVG